MVTVDVLRILLIAVCSVSAVIMALSFVRHRKVWNEKTRDYWYGRMMWTLSGISAGVEGSIRHTPFRYSLIIILAAALATLKGNLQRGKWGNDE